MPLMLVVPDDGDSACISIAPRVPIKRPGGQIRRRHSVDFAPPAEDKVIEFEPVEEEDKVDLWYNKDDYDIIKARNSLIVKMMKKGDFEETDEHSFRGLEHKLREGHIKRRTNKFNALNAVLEEQDRQYARGTCSADNIALQYKRVAVDARQKAQTVGLEDARVNGVCVTVVHGGNSGNGDNDDDVSLSESPDDVSAISELDTVCSEDTQTRRTRLKSLFRGISHMKRGGQSRRASM